MKHAQTIAMARGLMAEGREDDVARMIEPLLAPLSDDASEEAYSAQVMLRALLARGRLLRHGDVPRVLALLAPFAPVAAREQLPRGVRAEVALWLGWAHAWQAEPSFDDARALHLLDEAERLFRAQLNAAGRCWTLLGQALAYVNIDEYQLMTQALDQASALEQKLQDTQATLWMHDLSVAAARFCGHYTRAQHHVDTLKALGGRQHNAMVLGRAHAYQSMLHFDLGRPLFQIIEEATEAVSILTRSVVAAGYPLLAAYRSHIQALVRGGRHDEAEVLIDEALIGAGAIPAAAGTLLTLRAPLRMIQNRYDEALALLNQGIKSMHRLQHQLLASSAALLRSLLLARQGQHERAQEWAHRAHRHARETGFQGQQLHALLVLARLHTNRGDVAQARAALREAEAHSGYFSVLPFAARRFHLLGRLSLLEGQDQDAGAYLTQALSAYSLIGDVYHTACTQLELAHLSRVTDPSRGRPLLEAAVLTFNRLQAGDERAEAQALLQSWPADPEPVANPPEADLGGALAQAALSVDLVAETWLRSAGRLLPGRWMGVFRYQDQDGWQKVVEHGKPPPAYPFLEPGEAEGSRDGICWLRLRSLPGPLFYFGIAAPSSEVPATHLALQRLRPWLPVATLALDHALLRAQRLNDTFAFTTHDEESTGTPLDSFVYASQAMRDLVHQIHRIRASHSPVLITGESGTGKELIAQAVHMTSERKASQFVAFNCSNVPHDLFDSHLFGHEKGAFTGAGRANPGVIRAADGGTLFLDEIGDLPLDVQPKLLRFLQEGEVFPLGAKRPLQVDVRVVAATNQALEQRIREGRFREDLYYRLNVIPLRVPPLRERREEIPLLVRHFLSVLRADAAATPAITNRALEALLRYDWPGNVRQLRNEVERALVFVSNEPAPTIDLDDLTAVIAEAADLPHAPAVGAAGTGLSIPGQDLEAILAETERALIERVLADTRGNVAGSADVLGLTRQGLYKKMKRLHIDLARFQQRRSGKPAKDSVLHLN